MLPAIEACQLTKTFPGGITALRCFDLRIPKGSIFGLIGPNGAGKTTLLRLLMGLLRRDAGTACVLQHDLWHAPRSVRSRVAYVSQTQHVHSWMTLEELNRYASYLYDRWDAAYARALAAKWRLRWNQQV